MRDKWNGWSWTKRMAAVSAVRPNEPRCVVAMLSQKAWDQLEPELQLAVENRTTVEEAL